MSGASLALFAAFALVMTLLGWGLSGYLTRVFERQPTGADRVLVPLERVVWRAMGVDPGDEMSWARYATCLIAFGLGGTLLLYALVRWQGMWPGGPEASFLATPMTGDLAMNTAVSFATTTTWQAYGGETTLRYGAQLVGLVVQNFLAGAAGLALGVAFVRGLSRERSDTVGNFWVDVTRAVLWVLLPMSLVVGLLLVLEGVPMNLDPYTEVVTLAGGKQTIAQGPVAALVAIKNLGTNGGGFFNVNGAHPYEGPTPLANVLAMLSIVALPAALPFVLGRMTGRRKLGWAVYAAMMALTVAGFLVVAWAEQHGNARFAALGVVGPNLEGKEMRFGVSGTALTTTITSNGATGSYNAMLDSFQPLGVAVPLVNMLLGDIAFGGLGTGLAGLVMTALVGVFVAGLMTGRAPSFLGKPLDPGAIKLLMIYLLLTPLTVLSFAALAVSTEAGRAGLGTNTGSRAFTEAVFAYASCMASNGLTMAGLGANTPFWNVTTLIVMMVGRFGLAAPALALAGRLGRATRRAETVATLPTDGALFVVLTLGTALLVGGLSYLPVLLLGPLGEHLHATVTP